MLLFQTTLRNCWEVCYYFVITVIGLTQTVFFFPVCRPYRQLAAYMRLADG